MTAGSAAREPSGAAGWERLRELIRDLSFRDDREFVLASGRRSNVFFDLKRTLLRPEGLHLVAEQMLAVVRKDPSVRQIGGLVMGAVPIVLATVLRSHGTDHPIEGFWVRKEAKSHGTQALIDGHLAKGARVIIVEDVTTTGGSALKAVRAAREAGAEVAKVVTVVERQEGARENLADSGLELEALYRKSDFTEKL